MCQNKEGVIWLLYYSTVSFLNVYLNFFLSQGFQFNLKKEKKNICDYLVKERLSNQNSRIPLGEHKSVCVWGKEALCLL